MKKIIITVFAILLSTLSFFNTSEAANKKKVVYTEPLITLSNGKETKDSFEFNFYAANFFIPPFQTKLPELPINMEMRRFGGSGESQEVEAGSTLEPEYVYAFKIKDSVIKKYRFVLNRIDKNTPTNPGVILSWQQVNELITFLDTNEENMSSDKTFNELYRGADFLVLQLYQRDKKKTPTETTVEKLTAGKVNKNTHNILGVTVPSFYTIAANEIYVDKAYSLKQESMSNFFLNQLHLQKTVTIQWMNEFNLMHYAIILEKNDPNKKITQNSNEPMMVKVDKTIKKIVKRMFYDNELNQACFKEKKGIASEIITLTSKNFTQENSTREIYQIDPKGVACCMGNSRCAAWIYGSTEYGDFTKLLGPIYPDEIRVVDTMQNNFGIKPLEVLYPEGNKHPPYAEYYQFNVNKYQLIRTYSR